MINLIKDMYSKIKLCVKGSNTNKTSQSVDVSHNDIVDNDTDHVDASDNDVNTNTFVNNDCFFTSIAGIFQGESLSPFLFSMFLNDLNDNLKTQDNVGVKFDEWLMILLLFADDMVIFSETRYGLQKGLDILEKYCTSWGLVVNVSKTKCVAFRNGGRIGLLDKWTYQGVDIETVNKFKYLGFVFGSSGKFTKGIEDLKCRGLRAMFGLKNILHKNPEMPPSIQIKLFNSLILHVLSNSCEIWGYEEAQEIERIYLSFFHILLHNKE